MKRWLISFFLIGFAVLLIQCNPVYRAKSVQFYDYNVTNVKTDSSFINFLQPYRDSLTKTMNTVVATLDTDLSKTQPEGTLGNIMADAMYEMAEKYYGEQPDAAFMNYGGIRLPVLKAGVITRGKLFELFPFDNVLVLVKLRGNVLQQFLDHISGRGGWPVAGMTMQIKKNKAVNIVIGGKPIDSTTTYTIALGDYTANGGDDAAMLKGLPQLNKGYLMRDALIDYFSSFTKAGKTITVQLQNRVSNVE
jgi:2',3'-cyclic-nucleotide 2'-phosphodiesterase (5'-nucleotidase family)